MHLAETHYDNAETGCCARLDTARWEGREHVWHDKPFLEGRVHAILHVPLDFGSVMARLQRTVEAAAAFAEEPLWLSEEVSPWRSRLLVATDRTVPHAANVALSGTFVSGVFEGPYRDAPRWAATMRARTAAEGRPLTRLLFYYATCPRCARRFGCNQSVVFAQVA
jgi:hypothetical protein